MSISRINTILLGHGNIFQKGPWKNDICYANSFRETIQADLPKHADCLHSAYNNILAFLKNAETRGHSECRKICEQILKKDPQNINANLQLYYISGSKEEKERILVTIGDIISSVSKDHNIGVALIELGTALSTLIPKYYEHDTEDVYDEEIDAVFISHSDVLEFKSDVTNLDIPWRNELDDSGIYNHEAKNVYRWYNAVIYLQEGLYRLRNSHVVSSSELEIYRFSLAQASNRLSHVLLSSGGADYQRDHYSNASMRCFCEVVNQLDHTKYGFYVSRAFAYLGLMIQKKKNLEDASLSAPEIFRRLADLERIWNEPEEAYNIAAERFEPDIVVCTRYGKFLVNARRYDEAISELQKMTQLSPCEKWFPNYVMMSAYYFKYVNIRDECQSRGQPLSTNAKEFLEKVLEYGSICKKGQSTMEGLYYYAKALFWAGTEFSPTCDMILRDEDKVKDALDVIKMIYEEYRNQDLTKIYKLHAECSKSLGNLEDSLHYMVCSFNASRRDLDTVLPSFKYLCLYGLGLAQSSDVPESTKTLALRYVKFAIEDEVRFCHFRFKDPDAAPFNDVDATVVQSILEENISVPLCKDIRNLENPPCRRWYSIYKEVRKLCDKFPEQMKLLLEYIHEKFMFVVGTQTMKVLTLIFLGKDHKEWTRQYNRRYPRTVDIYNPVDVSLFFKRLSILRKGNSRPVCTDLEYDFCVIHSPHEQDFVACHLRQELEEGLERFKGCIFERDAPRDQSVGDFLDNVFTKSNRIIIVISSFFLTHTLIRLQRDVLKRLEEMKDRLIPIKVEAVEEDDRFRWLFGDVIDGTSYPINWSVLRSRIIEDFTYSKSGNISSMLRGMKRLTVADNANKDHSCYKMNARPRGIALIINNIQFGASKTLELRRGAHIDEKNLKKLWTDFHFKTIVEKNLSKSDMQRELRKLARDSHDNYDCFVVCLMSHGDLGKVYGADAEPLDIHEIQSYFYAEECPSLAGKPKMFFIQACQGLNTQTGLKKDSNTILKKECDGGILEGSETDGLSGEINIIPNKADFLIGFSTTPGDKSFRHPTHGSIYVSILYRLMKELAKKGEDLQGILTKVTEQVCEYELKNESGDPVRRQVPYLCQTLTKKVYFH